MSYDTGNPVPSKDPRDLVDNAENMDEAVNGTGDSWTDRLGNSRPTLKRLEDDYPQAGADADRAEAAAADAETAQAAAEDAQSGAETAQTGAETAETNAAASASAAATSASDAQTYADAAATAPSIYADTAAGLAATSVDDYFYVPSGVSGELLILYRHDSGPTATEIGRTSSSITSGPQEYGFGITAVDADGTRTQYRDAFRRFESMGIAADAFQPPVLPVVWNDPFDGHLFDGQVIPNKRAAEPGANLNGYPTGYIPQPTGALLGTTVTQRYADGPTGTLTAQRVQLDADSRYVLMSVETFPAGDYTFRFQLKSTSGAGNQTLNFEVNNAFHEAINITEGSWTEYTYTWTADGSTALTLEFQHSAGFEDFLIDEIELFNQDDTSLPAYALEAAGHARGNHSVSGTFPFTDDGFLDLAASTEPRKRITLPSYPDKTTVSEIAVFASIRVPANQTQPLSNASIISADSDEDGVGTLTAFLNLSDDTNFHTHGDVTFGRAAFDQQKFNANGAGWVTVGFLANAERLQKFACGHCLADHDFQNNAFTEGSTLLLGGEAAIHSAQCEVGDIMVYINQSLSKNDCYSVMDTMNSRLQARGQYLPDIRDVLLVEGDSISTWIDDVPSTDGPGWNYQLLEEGYLNKWMMNRQLAWGSSVLGNPGDEYTPGTGYQATSLYDRLPVTYEEIDRCLTLGRKPIFCVMIGVNDRAWIAANGAAAYFARLEDYWQLIKDRMGDDGVLLVGTVTPWHTDSAFEAERGTLNTLILGSSIPDDFIDFAGNATLGTYSATTAPTGFVDDVHWDEAGSAIGAGIAKTVIESHRV